MYDRVRVDDDMHDIDEGIEDLSSWSTTESCAWLLHLLEFQNFLDNPYAVPYSNYVMSWPRAVPIVAIIIGQSPYPNNIFPETAAAMSFDKELVRSCKNINGETPLRSWPMIYAYMQE